MAWGNKKVSPAVRHKIETRGLHVHAIHQPAWRFRKDVDRKHSRVALPCDPWRAVISTERFMGDTFEGYGDTPDQAVLAAIPYDIRAAMARLELAIDSLRDCLQK